MSLLVNQTSVNPTTFYYGSGGGGGGSGSNIVASTITLSGTTDPLEITLPATANDGFSVRQGGVTNPIAILTVDAGNAGQAEFGIRSLSTIGGNPVPRGRFEMTVIPGLDGAALTYTLDTTGSGNASTIGSVAFGPTNSGNNGVTIITEESAAMTLGENGYQIVTNSRTGLNPRIVAPTPNVYVPADGSSQTVASFSTIAGHIYEMVIPNLRVQNEPAGAPAAGAWSQLVVDATPNIAYLDTFNMEFVSTIDNDYQKSPCYCFTASGAGHNLVASGSLANSLSTAMTFGGNILLRDLGIPSAMLPANIAP